MNKKSKRRKRVRFLIILAVILVAIVGGIVYEKGINDTKIEKSKKVMADKKKQEEKSQQEKLKKRQEEDNKKIAKAVAGEASSQSIPILMYHSIKYEKGNELRIPKDKFKQQMQYLKDDGFHPISFDELYSYYVFNEALPDKPIVITFDDGYKDNYTNAYPVLKDLGFKATIFMITNSIGDTSDYITADQLKEMDKNGIDIESHTVTHKYLSKLSYDEQKKELYDSKTKIEETLGKSVKYIAYPFGDYNDDTLKLTEQLGYKLAVTTKEGTSNKSQGIYKLKRVYISNNYSFEYYKKLVNQK